MKPPEEIIAVILALQAGQQVESHFERLYLRYHGQVYRFFRRQNLSAENAEELTQNTFLSVYRHLESLRQAEQFESWLFQIARRELYHQLEKEQALKRKGPTVSLEVAGAAELAEEAPLKAKLSDSVPSPQELLLDQEARQVLRAAVRQLPEQMRRCMELRVLMDLPYHEIAQVLGLSINTVKSHLFQGREQLRRRLGAYFDKLEV